MTQNNPAQQFAIILVMMLLAFYVQELPTSHILQMILPEWPFILTLYFATSTRYFFGVISAFIVGLIEDAFLDVPTLGLHAGIYVLAAFILVAGRLRFKHMTIPMQSLTIGMLVLMKFIIVTIYSAVFYSMPSHFWALLSIPISMLLWPGVYLFFRFFSDRHSG